MNGHDGVPAAAADGIDAAAVVTVVHAVHIVVRKVRAWCRGDGGKSYRSGESERFLMFVLQGECGRSDEVK